MNLEGSKRMRFVQNKCRLTPIILHNSKKDCMENLSRGVLVNVETRYSKQWIDVVVN